MGTGRRLTSWRTAVIVTTVRDLGIFARYDDGARAAVLAANQLAAGAAQAELGLAYLALGVLETADSELVGALRAADVEPVALRAAIVEHLPTSPAVTPQPPAFNDDCQAAMAFAHGLTEPPDPITAAHLLAGVIAVAPEPLRATFVAYRLRTEHLRTPPG